MKDYSESLNAANVAPNSASTPYRGSRAPVSAFSPEASAVRQPLYSPTSPQKPAVPFDQVNNPAPYAAEVVEMNEKD